MDKTRIKRFKITLPDGEVRSLEFQPLVFEDTVEQKFCYLNCPYGIDVCNNLRDPRDPSNENRRFMDFCNSLGSEETNENHENREDFNYCPCKGTIERNLGDVPELNIKETILKEDKMFRLSEVIDKCCQDCPAYTPEHTNCSGDFAMCLLSDLIKTEDHESENSGEQ